MLAVVQNGQAGKSKLLLEMHRLRKRVFHDRMGWDVHITPGGLEVDQYDRPETIYLLAMDDDERVIGNWRLLPTTSPYMIDDLWSEFFNTLERPRHNAIWEASRFAVDSVSTEREENLAQVAKATQELFCGLTELCLLVGIREIYTMYNMHIARLLKRLNCVPENISEKQLIAGNLCEVGRFVTDERMLSKLRASTGIQHNLIDRDALPLDMQFAQFDDFPIQQKKLLTKV